MPSNSLGGSINNEAGALIVDIGGTGQKSYQELPGDWSNNNITLEIWFKPDNLAPTPANGQILFEDGGGTGLGFFIDDNHIEVRRNLGHGRSSTTSVPTPARSSGVRRPPSSSRLWPHMMWEADAPAFCKW